MTLKEADVAAQRGYPIIYNGVEYERIVSVGCNYDAQCRRFPSVQLLAKGGNSTTYANPEQCTLPSEFFSLLVIGGAENKEKEPMT